MINGGHLDSFRINLESFRTFCQRLFNKLSSNGASTSFWSKAALEFSFQLENNCFCKNLPPYFWIIPSVEPIFFRAFNFIFFSLATRPYFLMFWSDFGPQSKCQLNKHLLEHTKHTFSSEPYIMCIRATALFKGLFYCILQ